MSVRRVPASQLGTAIYAAVRDYTEEVTEAIKAEVEQTAKDVRSDIEAHSPKLTGAYQRGWRIFKRDRQGSILRVVHNQPRHMLVHLLEKGHAKRGGGRTKSFEHVKPAADPRLDRMYDNIKAIIRRGG